MYKYQFVKVSAALEDTNSSSHIVIPVSVYHEGMINNITLSRDATVDFDFYVFQSLVVSASDLNVEKPGSFTVTPDKAVYCIYKDSVNSDLYIRSGTFPIHYKNIVEGKNNDYFPEQKLYLVFYKSIAVAVTISAGILISYVAR
jgi:hypothetical protein